MSKKISELNEVMSLGTDDIIPVVASGHTSKIEKKNLLAITGGTENNFCSIDSDGNPKDSGKSASDFATSGEIITDHGALNGLGDDDHAQYHTDSRADTWLGTKDTDSLSEGTSNLYYTEARVNANPNVTANTAKRTYPVADENKLAGIEDGADVTDTENVTNAGAEMTANKGTNNGYAGLDGTGKVPSSQLPAFVDDVIEANDFASLPGTGETGKIYVTKDDNKTYRWGGTDYVEISSSLALGETSATAYRGDRGKTAYDHSLLLNGNPHNVTANDIGVEDGATADQSDTEIETAYNNRVAVATQSEAEAGTLNEVRRWTPLLIRQAIQTNSYTMLKNTVVTLTNANTTYKLPDTEMTGRQSVILYNESDTDMYYGESSVTINNGTLLKAGAEVSIDVASNLYAICGVAGKKIRVLEMK